MKSSTGIFSFHMIPTYSHTFMMNTIGEEIFYSIKRSYNSDIT